MRTFGFFGAWLRSFCVGPLVFLVAGLLVLLIARWFMRRRENAWTVATALAFWALTVVIFLCSFSVVPYLFERPLVWTSRHLVSKNGVHDHMPELRVAAHDGRLAILVLGGGAGDTMLTLQSMRRLDRGLELLGELPGSTLVFSEGIGDMDIVQPWTENYIRGQGGDVGRVVFECQSENTRENFINSLPIFERLGATEIVLVTGTRHMPRAYAVARDLGLAPYIAVMEEDDVPAFYPDWNAYLWLGGVLNEYVGIAGYKLVGWL
jgi:uncharacterized SAM-binding protein YcdF (DUF218 family)